MATERSDLAAMLGPIVRELIAIELPILAAHEAQVIPLISSSTRPVATGIAWLLISPSSYPRHPPTTWCQPTNS